MARKEKQEGNVDMQEMMETYRRLGTPGAEHKMMEKMAGRWEAKVRSWMEPDNPPMESTGISESKLVLGGRFLQQEFTGDMMGTLFTGIGFMGYDNHTKKWISTWMDSMGTAIMFFEGTDGADGKTITQESSYDDPFKGPMKWRSVTRILDDDTHFFEMYSSDKSGKEVKMMEITYARKESLEHLFPCDSREDVTALHAV
jgi:hypothetical protein